jgi:hypothetical protein
LYSQSSLAVVPLGDNKSILRKNAFRGGIIRETAV